MRWIIELEPGNYLLAILGSNKSMSRTHEKSDAKRFANVYRAGDVRDLMKRDHGFDGARIVGVES